MYQYELTITQKSEVALSDLFREPLAPSVELGFQSIVNEVFRNTLGLDVFNLTLRAISGHQTVVRFEAERLVTHVFGTPLVDDLRSVFLMDGGTEDFAFDLTAASMADVNHYAAQAMQIAWEQEKEKIGFLNARIEDLQVQLDAALSTKNTPKV